MSTRSSIHYGNGYHLYNEALDNENVYLELSGGDLVYEIRPGAVMLRIPGYIWEVIRRHQQIDTDLVDMTDDQLRDKAWAEIDGRMRRIREATEKYGKPGFEAARGCLVYGSADDPVEMQVERMFEWYDRRRAIQRHTQAEIVASDKYRSR